MSKRLVIIMAVAAAVLLGGAYVVYVQTRTHGDPDPCLERSGCIASHEYPNLRFPAAWGHPGMAFEGDTNRVAMAMIETGPADSNGEPTARWTLLEVAAESGDVLRQTPLGDFKEDVEIAENWRDLPLPLGLIAVSWNGQYAALADWKSQKGNSDEVTLKLMPLTGDSPGWEQQLSEEPSVSARFDSGNQRFQIFDKTWAVDGQQTDQQVAFSDAYGIVVFHPVKAPDGTIADLKDGRILEITQPDGRRSSYERSSLNADQMLLSPAGSKLALWGTDDGVGTLEVWDTRTGDRLISAAVPGIVRAAWSADSRRLAVMRDSRDGAGYSLFSVDG